MADGDNWNDGIFWKAINILVYFFFLGADLYSTVNPSDTSAVDTYITPAPWALYTWYLIHFLLLGTLVYQFFPIGHKVIIKGISWRFPLVALLNSIYITLAAKHHYIAAFVTILILSAVVTHIYYIIKKFHAAESLAEELFVHLPFSMWHGWTAVVVLIASLEAFGIDASEEAAGFWTKLIVFIFLFSLTSTSATYAFGSAEGDLPGSVVITYNLYAIFAHQTTPLIHWTALTGAIISTFCVVKGLYGVYLKIQGGSVRIDDAERGPLVSHQAVGGRR